MEIDLKKLKSILDTLTEAIEHTIEHDSPNWLELFAALKFCEEFHNSDPILNRLPVSDQDKERAIKLAHEMNEFCKKHSGASVIDFSQDDKSIPIDDDKYRN